MSGVLVMGIITRGPNEIRYPCSNAFRSLGCVAGIVISKMVCGGSIMCLRKWGLFPPTNRANELVSSAASFIFSSKSGLLMIETAWKPRRMFSLLEKGTISEVLSM